MVRILVATLAGAVVLFIWNMMAWMMLPLHVPTISQLPDEDAVVEMLQAQELETGVYMVPWGAEEDFADPESTFMQRHTNGPIFSIYYSKEGQPPLSSRVMIGGFVLNLAACLIAGLMLTAAASGCCKGFLSRVGFVFGFGLFLELESFSNGLHRRFLHRSHCWLDARWFSDVGDHSPECYNGKIEVW